MSDKSAVDEELVKLFSHIKTMITHSGDTSNLILDPDLDSYYLMDVTLLALPQTEDRIRESTHFVRSLAEKKKVSESEKVQASVYAALLKQSDLDRILASAQTSLNEDQNFYGVRPSLQTNLGDRLKSLEVELTKLISLLGEIGQKGEAALPELQSLSSLVASTEDTIYPFHFKAFDELDVFLNKRISHFEPNRGAFSALQGRVKPS